MRQQGNGLSTRQLAAVLRVHRNTVLWMTHRLPIPHAVQRGAFRYDPDDPTFPEFFASVRYCLRHSNVKPFYSMSELGRMTGKSYRTIARLLIRNQIPFYRLGVKRIVFVTQLRGLGFRASG